MKKAGCKKLLLTVLVGSGLFMPGMRGLAAGQPAAPARKAALLIVRVGNVQAFSPMKGISLKTDYARRVPRSGQDVYIDDEARLRAAVPTYPKYAGNSGEYAIEFFRNITSELTAGIKAGFESKGIAAFDLRDISGSWSQPFPEMKVSEIIALLQDAADYLFVLHYMDVGNSLIRSARYRLTAANSGFTSLVFGYSLFDVKKSKRLFSYSPIIGFATLPAIIYNPGIMTDPVQRQRVRVICSDESGSRQTEIHHDFSDAEIIKLLVSAILDGFDCSGRKFIACYDECKYYDLKGLLAKLPE